MQTQLTPKWLWPGTLLAVLIVIAVHLATRPQPDRSTFAYSMVRLAAADAPLFIDDMNGEGLEHGIEQSLAYLKRIAPSTEYLFGQDRFTAQELISSLHAFQAFIRSEPDHDALQAFLRTNCWIYAAADDRGHNQILFTGYYEPAVQGRLQPDPVYTVPVYPKPDDLLSIDLTPFGARFEGLRLVGQYLDGTLRPYPDHQAIAFGKVLEGRVRPLAWLKDPVDLLFLQIQGSGKVLLETGEPLNIHYHASNGRPYRSIGKLLIEQNKIAPEKMSMQAIRSYLKDHPEEVPAVLSYNPSYVFFKLEQSGPLGCLNVPLTAGRSLAVDRKQYPDGALAFIQLRKPLLDHELAIDGWDHFSRFVLLQDTGGAIKGRARADLFWGNGPYAEIAAGHQKHYGRLFFIVVKSDFWPNGTPLAGS